MKIKKVIKIFEKAYKDYDEASKIETSYNSLWSKRLVYGLCWYTDDVSIVELFDIKDGYYACNISRTTGYLKNLKDATNVFDNNPNLHWNTITNKYQKCLAGRAKWLKKEIENLNNLLKEGYTDI